LQLLPTSGHLDMAPFGKQAKWASLELLISYAAQQGQISRPLDGW
jgi:hypothetical protein